MVLQDSECSVTVDLGKQPLDGDAGVDRQHAHRCAITPNEQGAVREGTSFEHRPDTPHGGSDVDRIGGGGSRLHDVSQLRLE
jgi:hypothetical protein